MKPMAEPDPYPDPHIGPPVISDTQTWIEIAYLDSCSDYRESLLDSRVPTTTKRKTMGARNWLLVLALIAFAMLTALWSLR